MTNIQNNFCWIVLSWTPTHLIDDRSTLARVMDWCRQKTINYLNQWRPRSMLSVGTTSHWINLTCCFRHIDAWIKWPTFCIWHFKMNVLNTLRPRQNGRRFPDDTFKRIFLNENVRISIKISLKFVPNGPINNIPSLVQTMAWHRPGDKPLSDPMMVRVLTHICVNRPQWIKWTYLNLD